MKLVLGPEVARAWAMASPEEQAAIIAGMSPRELLWLDAQFELWAQEGQLPPQGEGWRTWLMLAGRGFGKTRAGAEWVHNLAMPGAKDRAGRGEHRRGAGGDGRGGERDCQLGAQAAAVRRAVITAILSRLRAHGLIDG